MTDADARDEPPGHGWADALAAAFVIFQGGQVGWEVVDHLRQGGGPGAWEIAGGAAALSSITAFVGLVYHRRWGWAAGVASCAVLGVAWLARLVRTPHAWYAALLAGTVAALAYLWWTRALYDGHPRAHAAPVRPEARDGRDPRPADGAAVAAALQAVGRMLADAGGPSAVTPEAVREVTAAHGLAVRDLGPAAEALYRRYLESYAADGALTPDEEHELAALRALLELDDEPAAASDASAPTGSPSPAPPADPGVPPAVPADPVADGDRAASVEADALSREEAAELRELSRRAAVPVDQRLPRRELLARLRMLRDALTEPLPSIPFDGALEAGERPLAARDVEVYRAPAASAAEAEGTRRAVMDARSIIHHDAEPPRPREGLERIGGGRLVLTDRRLLLVNAAGQLSPLPLERLRRARPRADGLEVVPLRGRPLFLAFDDAVPEFAARLARVLRDRSRGAR